MRKYLFIAIFIFFLSSVYAYNFYPFDLNTQSRTVHSNNFSYSLKDSGLVHIKYAGQDIADLGFAVYGETPDPTFLKSWNVSWSWQTLSNTDKNITVLASTSYSNFFWQQEWSFPLHQNPKLTQFLRNQTGITITNMKMYEILDINSDVIKSITYYNDLNQTKTFTFDGTDFEFNGNLNLSTGKIIFNADQNSFFDFTDLFSDFNVVYFFAGNLQNAVASLPDTNGIIVGFTKDTGQMPNNTSVLIDPTFDDFEDNSYTGSWDYSETESDTYVASGTETSGYLQLRVNGGISGTNRNANGTFILKDANSLIFTGFPLDIYFTPYNTISGGNNGSGTVTATIYLSDGTTDVNLMDFMTTHTGAGSTSHPQQNVHFKMSLTNTDGNNVRVDLNTGGSYTKSLTTIDVTNIRIKFYVTGTLTAAGGGDSASADTSLQIFLIDYNPASIDLNIVNPKTGTNWKGGSTQTIDFNVLNPDKNAVSHLIDVNYGTTQTPTTVILTDGNVASTPDLSCDSNNFSVRTQCHYTWTVPSLDGNYFINIDLNDGIIDRNKLSNSFYIDSTKPTTSFDGNSSWQTTDANIHLTCSDSGSGCSQTKYRLDTNASSGISYGTWQTYDKNILISQDGNIAIDFNSTDIAGNVGDTNTFYVLIDQEIPVIANVTPTENRTQTSSIFTFTVSVSDTYSGASSCDFNVFVNDIIYQVNQTTAVSGGNCTYSTVYTTIDDDMFVTWKGKDSVGNYSTDLNSFKIKYFVASTSPGTGGGIQTVITTPENNFDILEPKTTEITFDVYPGYSQKKFFTIKNKTGEPHSIKFSVSNELKNFVFFDSNEVNFQGLEEKKVYYTITIPQETELKKYFGTLILDTGENTAFDVTLNVKEKNVFVLAGEFLFLKSIPGIPNLVLIILLVFVLLLFFAYKKDTSLKNTIKRLLRLS